MMRRVGIWISLMVIGATAGCAVMPRQMTREALPQRPFTEMVEQAQQLKGRTVIMGGYVVSAENRQTGSTLVVVHTPLGAGQRPKSKDLSKGRLIIEYDGFLDPEIYTKDRVITVGGVISGSSKTETSQLPYPYLRIQARKIYLWPVVDPRPVDPFWYDDCYPYYPYRWWRPHHPWCW